MVPIPLLLKYNQEKASSSCWSYQRFHLETKSTTVALIVGYILPINSISLITCLHEESALPKQFYINYKTKCCWYFFCNDFDGFFCFMLCRCHVSNTNTQERNIKAVCHSNSVVLSHSLVYSSGKVILEWGIGYKVSFYCLSLQRTKILMIICWEGLSNPLVTTEINGLHSWAAYERLSSFSWHKLENTVFLYAVS